MASIFAVELSHEGLVGVADEQNGCVEGLDLLLAAFMGLDADGPPASPVVPLTFEPFVVQRAIKVVAASVEAGGQLDEVASPRVASAREAG